MKKIAYLTILVSLFIPFFNAFAHDTDLYVLDQSMQQVPPDALITLDLSYTMVYPPPGTTLYAPGTTCNKNGDGPFYPNSGTGHTAPCTWTATEALSIPYWGNSESCSGPFYKTSGMKGSPGINFSTNCRRIEIAKRAIFHFLDTDASGTIDAADEEEMDMRMGYMKFSTTCGGPTKVPGTHYSEIYCASGTSCTITSSGANSVSSEFPSLSTPYTALASALTQAKTYYDSTKISGNPNYDNAADCRQKFVILITDGEDSVACGGPVSPPNPSDYKRRRETVAKAKALANAGYLVFVVGFGGDMPHYLRNTLNWVAYYGGTDNPSVVNSGSPTGYPIPYGQFYPKDIYSCSSSSTASCTLEGDTHTKAISYDPGEASLSGYAFLASDASQLTVALEAIRNYIIAILAKSASYVAPVVPISQMEKTSSGNRMYLGMFKPTVTSFWKGNIKKYGIATEDTEVLKIGDIIDAKTPPELIMDPWNRIKDTAKSYWSSVADGGDVEKGGVGGILSARNLTSNPRNIYTYIGTSTSLTDSSNAFVLSNAAITTTTLAVSTTAERDDIIKFVHGWDPYDENKNGIFDEKRSWILGAFIHSRPLIIHYSDRSVIYGGANDGMLHAFDDATGEELWAFIPPNLLPNLRKFKDELSLQTLVDGSPRYYETPDLKILIFGQRRGGNRYIALDVTNPLSSVFLWEISPSRTGYKEANGHEELGQTWGTPKLGKIKNGSGEKWVFFIGGGYDENQDSSTPGSDTKGRAVYVVDVLTGDLIWKYSYTSKSTEMSYCIPGDITRVDIDGDGKVDRLYAGDMGGRIWRFNIGDAADTASWTGKIIFSAPSGSKIFYPPDVTLEKDSEYYEMLFFGTGDRENPKDVTIINKLYAVKDKNPSTPLTESSLVDVTQDLLQDPNTLLEDKTALLDLLKERDGWYITLNQNSGEKCLSEPVVYAGATYYTTFSPTLGSPSDICFVGEGTGRIYALKYKTGNAAFNLDANNDLEGSTVIKREDRSMTIGSGIPSGVILTVIGGTVTGYAGVAGGVYSPTLSSTRSIVPINWKIVF
jgi:type IV pilus assembly protein PilY1